MVEFYNPITKSQISYHIDKRMIKFLDKVKYMISKKDKDYVMIIDGYEGSGKSTASQQWGKYVDNSLDLPRICMTADEFKQAIVDAKQKQCVIYDEAVTGMTSGDSISRIGKLLKSMMMQMRQKNLFVIVIIPTIFELNKYTVLSRARSFFHIYESKGKMGYFVGYNKKDTKLLYLRGKKTYTYKVRSRFIGRFYGKYVVDEAEYRKKKEEALFSIDNDEKKEKDSMYKVQRDFLIQYLKKQYKLGAPTLENVMKRCKYPIGRTYIGEVLRESNGESNEMVGETMEINGISA
jgi:hypothetical protein